MRVYAFVQARMGSTRLPGKVLKQVLGRPLLDFLVERLQQSEEIDQIVILTTSLPAGDPIENYCQKKQIACFRGLQEDVLGRFYHAALAFQQPNVIVRVTADCPLIDPQVIDEAIELFNLNLPFVDYLSNCLTRTYPRGLDVEIFSFQTLEKAHFEAHSLSDREHVTPYIYRNNQLFRLINLAQPIGLSAHRWTVDTPEDFELVKLILETIYPNNPRFRMKNILNSLERHPEWSLLNRHIEQKKQ